MNYEFIQLQVYIVSDTLMTYSRCGKGGSIGSVVLSQ